MAFFGNATLYLNKMHLKAEQKISEADERIERRYGRKR